MKTWEQIGLEIKDKYEKKIRGWNNKTVEYREGRLYSRGTVKIETSDWGVTIMINADNYDKPIKLSGVWSILHVGSNSISASYVNWHLTILDNVE